MRPQNPQLCILSKKGIHYGAWQKATWRKKGITIDNQQLYLTVDKIAEENGKGKQAEYSTASREKKNPHYIKPGQKNKALRKNTEIYQERRKKMKPQELKILQELRKNSRRSLTDISDSTGIPLSTVFKKVNLFEKSLVKKYVTLIDFNTLGLNIRISLVLKSKDRESLKKFLSAHKNVNSLYRISQSFDFFVETIFPNMLEFENFLEEINDMVLDKKVFHIIEDLRKEDFAIIKDERAK